MPETANAIRQRAKSLAMERVQRESILHRHTASDLMQQMQSKAKTLVHAERTGQNNQLQQHPFQLQGTSSILPAQLASFRAFTAQRAATHGASALHAHATRRFRRC